MPGDIKVISPTGNDTTGTGSEANPWLTLNKLAANLGAGDIGYMRANAGPYAIASEHSFNPIGSASQRLKITTFPGDVGRAIFDGGAGSFPAGNNAILLLAANSQYTDLENIEVRNNATAVSRIGRGLGISSSVAGGRARHLTFRNLKIHDIWERPFGGGGDDILLEDSEIYNGAMKNENEALGGGSGWAAALSTVLMSDGSTPKRWTVRRCNIHNNWGEGAIAWDVGASQIDGMDIYDTLFRNNYSKLLYFDGAHGSRAWNNLLVFDDPTYNKLGNAADGIGLAVEGTATDANFGLDTITLWNNRIVGANRGITWFTDSNNLYSTYRNLLIYFNTFYALAGASLNVLAKGVGANTPENCQVKDNCFEDTMATLNDAAAWTFDYNRWDSIPGVGTHTNSITASPLFSQPAASPAANLRPATNSPLVRAGLAIASITTDADSRRRFNPPTIGAYERNPYAAP